MMNKIKNIKNLTKIFLKDSFQSSNFIDKNTNKINKKSIFVWTAIIVIFVITYLSFELIKILENVGIPSIFLRGLFLITNIVIIFQVVLLSVNIYFFSKNFDMILPIPIKPEELLIAKFNTILINLYFSELMIAVFPLIL